MRTDHGSLRWLLNFQNPEGQVARWIQVLGEYDYQVVHRPGKGHGNADGLSRKPCGQCQLTDEEQPSRMQGTKRKRQRKNLSVHWGADDDLVEIRHFEYDPEERVDVSKLKGYFREYYENPYDHQTGVNITKVNDQASTTKPEIVSQRRLGLDIPINDSPIQMNPTTSPVPDHPSVVPVHVSTRQQTGRRISERAHTKIETLPNLVETKEQPPPSNQTERPNNPAEPVEDRNHRNEPDHSLYPATPKTAELSDQVRASQTEASISSTTTRLSNKTKHSVRPISPAMQRSNGNSGHSPDQKTATERTTSEYPDQSNTTSVHSSKLRNPPRMAKSTRTVNQTDLKGPNCLQNPEHAIGAPSHAKRLKPNPKNIERTYRARTQKRRNKRRPTGNKYVRLVTMNSLWSAEEMKTAQESDPDLSLIVKAKQKGGPRPEWEEISPLSKTAKCYWAQWDRLELRNEMLHSKWESGDGKTERWQLVVPHSYKDKVLKELHSSRTAGHLGVNKTRERVRERFYWVAFNADVRSWIRKCDVCARRKSPSTRSRAKLTQEVAGHRGQRVAMDILGPLPVSSAGNRHILVVGDYFSKWIEAYAIPDEQAETCAKKITEEWISRQGCPETLHSDQGTNFESKVMTEVCKLLGIDKTRTTPLHPQSDGLIERFNRTMLDIVSALIEPDNNQKDWDEVLPYTMMAYRSSVQASTGETPYLMTYGEEMVLPIDLFGSPTDPEQDNQLATDYAKEIRQRLRDAHIRARAVLQSSSRRQKRNYDKKAVDKSYLVGSFVWLHNEVRKKGRCPKLEFKWHGPFLVIKKLSDVVYRIQQSPQSKPKVVHIDRLKQYQGKDLRSWLRN